MSETSNSSSFILQVAQIVADTQAEGPGHRFAVWLQGCPLRCPGCCNPEMLPFSGGHSVGVSELLTQFRHAVEANPHIEGVTLLGGEPFSHPGVEVFAGGVRDHGGSVMIFTGFTLNELKARPEAHVQELLAETDLLVDGPYLRDQPDTTRRWIGSQNQQIHFLTERYHPDSASWDESDTLEIRLQNGQVTVNGFPAPSAVGVWRRIKPSSES
ncbi:4Fe-4S single cluster domain-containing protein [Thalassoroseus pseudoceratinae]|uniref:4Fe-4S single cluster domain-containing protein n=1 Tax=Thalassoroseus pseudoceratinae TaxID=2713176 RepID=UPI0014246E83|nr:4Fe-4S single cluster domain-containing protein [Thalassoroseus pseudoceratinae]